MNISVWEFWLFWFPLAIVGAYSIGPKIGALIVRVFLVSPPGDRWLRRKVEWEFAKRYPDLAARYGPMNDEEWRKLKSEALSEAWKGGI